MRPMTAHRRLSAAIALALTSAACATTSPLVRQECYNADAQLAAALRPYEEARVRGCDIVETATTSDCDRHRREIVRLASVCVGHAPTLMANAVIAYDERQPVQAQQYLDSILAQPRPYPDASALRARLAIEEGNVRFAQRLLQQQIRLTPDHAALHETYAAALYLDRRLTDARDELTLARALGAPAWRVAYHFGLIEESLGRRDEAARYYTQALDGNPGWATAQARLRALQAQATAPPSR